MFWKYNQAPPEAVENAVFAESPAAEWVVERRSEDNPLTGLNLDVNRVIGGDTGAYLVLLESQTDFALLLVNQFQPVKTQYYLSNPEATDLKGKVLESIALLQQWKEEGYKISGFTEARGETLIYSVKPGSVSAEKRRAAFAKRLFSIHANFINSAFTGDDSEPKPVDMFFELSSWLDTKTGNQGGTISTSHDFKDGVKVHLNLRGFNFIILRKGSSGGYISTPSTYEEKHYFYNYDVLVSKKDRPVAELHGKQVERTSLEMHSGEEVRLPHLVFSKDGRVMVLLGMEDNRRIRIKVFDNTRVHPPTLN